MISRSLPLSRAATMDHALSAILDRLGEEFPDVAMPMISATVEQARRGAAAHLPNVVGWSLAVEREARAQLHAAGESSRCGLSTGGSAIGSG